MREQDAELDGWNRTMELRWLISPTPGEWPTLQQRWTRVIQGYGEDMLEEQWLAIATARG